MDDQLTTNNLSESELVEYLTTYIHNISKNGTKVVALVGGPASGKTTLASKLVESLGSAAFISTDSYVKGDRNFRKTVIEDQGVDPINKYDFSLLEENVREICNLKESEEIKVPEYDQASGIAIGKDPDKHSPENWHRTIGQVKHLIIEGDFQPLNKDLVDRIIYLDIPNEVRLENRLHRDLEARGEPDRETVINRFNRSQVAQFTPYTLPQKSLSDLVIKADAKLLEQPTPKRKYDYIFSVIKNHSI